MAESESKKVIKLVPEYLLKKRKTYQAIKATQAKLALLEKRKVTKGKPLKFRRLEDFLKDCHKKHRDETRIRRADHRPAAPLPPEKNKLAFAMRIRESEPKGSDLQLGSIQLSEYSGAFPVMTGSHHACRAILNMFSVSDSAATRLYIRSADQIRGIVFVGMIHINGASKNVWITD
ncbi:hypothetical protein CRENBAI_009813 [Crenichthys baileyi]|uniref:Large ribosomal subunit protein uL30 N-terminal eukaryotes domain-containing protein n=1 Tax=Crenichthys baileyi TaxID=28760 RepID=A0AAV9RUC5_9TELE